MVGKVPHPAEVGGGYPLTKSGWGVPHSGDGRGTPFPGLDGGVPSRSRWRGTPLPGGGYPGEPPAGYTPQQGTPHPDQITGWGGATPTGAA